MRTHTITQPRTSLMICDSPRYGVGSGDKAALICRSTGNLPVVLLRDVPSRPTASYAQIWSLCPRWSETVMGRRTNHVCSAPRSGLSYDRPLCARRRHSRAGNPQRIGRRELNQRRVRLSFKIRWNVGEGGGAARYWPGAEGHGT